MAPLVVGLTVVAGGTSSPEFFVVTSAALAGRDGISLGNVLGANSLNIGVILGLTALVRPLQAQMQLIRFDVPIMILASLVVAAGTTVPELISCLVAALKREGDIAIGNIIGSNIFNLLGVLGLAGTLAPISAAGVQPAEIWGALLLALYAFYLALIWTG